MIEWVILFNCNYIFIFSTILFFIFVEWESGLIAICNKKGWMFVHQRILQFSFSLSVCLPVCFSFCLFLDCLLPVSLSLVFLNCLRSVSLSLCLFFCLFYNCLSIFFSLFVFQLFYFFPICLFKLSVCLSVCFSLSGVCVCQSDSPFSFSLFLCFSFCLFVFQLSHCFFIFLKG